MSFWDELKELFKTDEERDEERRRRLAEAQEGTSNLEKELAALDAEYKKKHPKATETYDLDALFPKESGLKEIDYEPKSDEELKKLASKQADYQNAVDKNNVEAKYRAEAEDLADKKQSADKSLKESYQNLQKVYDELRKNAENDAIKRGVARSSIITSRLDDIDYAKTLSKEEVDEAYNEKIGDIDGKLKALERDKDVAMSNLDLKYASAIEKNMADLQAERDDLVLKYEKYNNSIREKNNRYDRQRRSDIDKFLKEKEEERVAREKAEEEEEQKNGYTGDKFDEYQKRFDMAYEFYSSLSADIAVDALKSAPNMKYYLGLYYDKLLYALRARAANSDVRRNYG